MKMLGNFAESPEKFSEHIHLAMGTIILDITYGYETKPKDDEWIALADRVIHDFADAVKPGAWLVDVIPALKYVPDWVPGAGFKKQAKIWEATSQRLVEDQFATVKNAMKAGTAKSCIVTDHLEENLHGANIDEYVIKDMAAIAYAAGVDTMVGTLRSFILQMTRHPAVQATAQAEIDLHCPDRLPTFHDRPSLPYIESIMMEVCRFHPIVPQCMPHKLDEEDVFEGMRLMKDSIIIPNIWGMAHDETVYEHPEVFDPSRFMNGDKLKDAEEYTDPREMYFGFGRRECPGRAFGDSQVFLSIACILKIFNLGPPRAKDGSIYIPPSKYSSGVLSMPEEFQCGITPRNAQTLELMKHALEEN